MLTIEPNQIVIGFLLAVLIAGVSYRFKALSLSGVIATIVVGGITFGLGGLLFAIPILFFFISSNIISAIKTRRKRNALDNLGKSGPRDWMQVLANGGIGAGCAVVYFFTGNLIWYFVYLASFAESSSDTWATEIGTLSPRDPVSIISFKKVSPGYSGGISLMGIFAAIVGSAALVGAGFVGNMLIPNGFDKIHYSLWLVCINAGFAGSILDSIIGGSFQGLYSCLICRRLMENKVHCGFEAQLLRGFRLINNDTVNLISSSFAAAMIILYYFL